MSCSKRAGTMHNVCLRNSSGQFIWATCNAATYDPRIPCRKLTDPMTWYRGYQSVTVSGKKCERWDSERIKEVINNLSEEDFEAFDAPSLTYSRNMLISTGLHSHENFCRNPDNWKHGPWCAVKEETGKLKKEACFKACTAANKERELCLAKMLFPYKLPVRTALIETPVVDPFPYEHDDLSDILDVPRVAQFNKRNRPMYVPTYFLDHIRKSQADISTRVRCYQTGRQTRIAGPWTYTTADELPFFHYDVWLEEGLIGKGADRFARERAIRGDTGPQFSLWRPCFLACEDADIKCWPTNQTVYYRPRFPYYGPRSHTAQGNKCISPSYAYQILVSQKALKRAQKTYLDILKERYFTDKDGYIELKNVFASSEGSTMTSNRCFTLGDFLLETRSKRSKGGRGRVARRNEVLNRVMSIGAGCFIESVYQKEVEYRQCFNSCDCNDELQPPEIFFKDKCKGKDKCEQSGTISKLEDYDIEGEEAHISPQQLLSYSGKYLVLAGLPSAVIITVTALGFIGATLATVYVLLFMKR